MQDHGTRADIVLLGLERFRVLAAVEDQGELLLLVETTTEVVGCPDCGTRARSQGRRETDVRDLPAGGRPVRLRWRKRLWRCPDPDCPKRTWSETSSEIRPRASLTERARRDACHRVGREGDSVAAVARSLGVGWGTVMAAVWDYGSERIEGLGTLEGVGALGMDEHRWRSRPDRWATSFVDLEAGRILEVVPGRSGDGVRGFLGSQEREIRRAVQVVALDPWRGYLGPVRKLLSEAQVTVDHFHLIRLANQVVTEVRQRTQQEVVGHRGRKGDPLYGIRHTLLRGRERLRARDWVRLEAALSDPRGDRYEEVACAWVAKELLRDVYRAEDLSGARRALTEFYGWADEVAVPEVDRLARTVGVWEEEVLNYHRTGMSNGMTEAMNLLVEKVRRVGHGFRNWDNYRLRVLLHCGVKWETAQTAKVRGRGPRLVA